VKVVGVIPARFASSRFPGKPLAPILGKPMIQWVYERSLLAGNVDEVLVATDDRRIHDAVAGFNGRCVLTGECATGSDRVFEAVRNSACDVVLNLQGDEPTLDPRSVSALVEMMLERPGLDMGTLVSPIRSRREYEDPNVVKVALGGEGRCLYFSRSPVPHLRDVPFEGAAIWRHVGIYAFRKPFLQVFTSWPRGILETSESLEQLRALENGVVICAAQVEWPGCAVDTPEDLPGAERALGKILEAEGGG
jgi:3-deoxy-manno-octulosonate cytidylyltransferase (CMP-KDO synthetase)